MPIPSLQVPAVMTQPRALFCIPRYWPSMGGAELHTREMARRLARSGDVGVVHHCSTEAATPEVSFASGQTTVSADGDIRVFQLGAQGIQRPLLQGLAQSYAKSALARALYTQLFKASVGQQLSRIAQDYDIIHAVYNGMTPSVELVADICRDHDLPFVWTPLAHTTLADGTGWSSPAFRRLYQRADALIAMTAYERDWLIGQGADPTRVHVCPVAALSEGRPDAARFRAEHNLGRAPVVLFLGRLVHSKGYHLLCEAARAVWRRAPDTRFVFVGPIAADVQDWFDARREPRFVVLGARSEDEKLSALAACDVFCVPSCEESLGVTYLEAWTFKKPVVALDIDVLRTVIADGQDGLLTPSDGDAIAEVLVHLLERPAVCRLMGENGARKVAAEYDWDVLARRLADIYRGVLQARLRQAA